MYFLPLIILPGRLSAAAVILLSAGLPPVDSCTLIFAFEGTFTLIATPFDVSFSPVTELADMLVLPALTAIENFLPFMPDAFEVNCTTYWPAVRSPVLKAPLALVVPLKTSFPLEFETSTFTGGIPAPQATEAMINEDNERRIFRVAFFMMRKT